MTKTNSKLQHGTHQLALERDQNVVMISRCLHGNKREPQKNGQQMCALHAYLRYDEGNVFERQGLTIVYKNSSDSHASHRQGKS